MSARPAHWWHDNGSVHRFVCDLLAGELARLRPGRVPPPLPWPPSTRFADDLGADSLERLQLGTALAEALHLHRAGIDDGLLTLPAVADWVEAAGAGLERFSAELTFRTSGSTGQPKWCVHTLADLAAEIEAIAPLLGRGRRVLAAVPSHHIYGFLFTILLPLQLNAELVDVRGQAPAQLAGSLEADDVVVGFPEFWRAFTRAAPPAAAVHFTAVNSTGPCPAEAARAVRGGGARYVDVYGSSETAGIGWRSDPAAAYTLLPYLRRGNSDGELVRRRPDGSENVLLAPDRLVWDGERLVRPAGRSEGAVQVGGINVFPEHVAAVLRTHPDVEQAAVRLMRPDEGDRLKAFIVPRRDDADPTALIAGLWQWIDAHLSAPERPKSIVSGGQLPEGLMGKAADWPIPAAVPGGPAVDA